MLAPIPPHRTPPPAFGCARRAAKSALAVAAGKLLQDQSVGLLHSLFRPSSDNFFNPWSGPGRLALTKWNCSSLRQLREKLHFNRGDQAVTGTAFYGGKAQRGVDQYQFVAEK
jgi:hypothetical protein